MRFVNVHASGEDERKKIRSNAIPRIIVPGTRDFSAQAADEDQPSKTFREKFADQRKRGTAAARKGASSFGEMIRRYGPVFVGTYFTVYVSTLGSLWGLVETGVVDPAYVISWIADAEDKKTTAEFIADFLSHYTLTNRLVPIVESNPSMANLAVAWIAVKFTEPLRFGVTMAIVPSLARALGYTKAEESTDDSEAAAATENKEAQKAEEKSEGVPKN